ncbi:hypothetical protein HNQ59_003971 [Chitinivorax tropicus]|uniref:Uncharacterized protein n=1 Tax=Chitinivorax tropicus TaxID=714531 RepID=A0A840MWE9_9PROT|nr:hypothetical protein [Chitinivorax tropicus]
MNERNGKTPEDRKRLLDAMEKNRDGQEPVLCDICHDTIRLELDASGHVIRTGCSCGKFNANFRPI